MAVLHTEYSSMEQGENKISDAARKIGGYIERYAAEGSFDDKLAQETDWRVFEQLSDLRTGLVSWYPFRQGARLLEVGAGFGALTGCLCERLVHVTATERSPYRAQALAKRYAGRDNLDIYTGDLSEMELPEKYDYILVNGLLERMGDRQGQYLERLRSLLAPGGRLLLAADNRFGLRYFCGARDGQTKRAFGGINQYDRATAAPHALSRQELDRMAKQAGFGARRFYYVLPDAKLPQLIYTDEYLPEKNLAERLIPYYPKNDTLVASELNLYDDLIDNGVFPFFANSFLLECAVQEDAADEEQRVVYAAVSTDRGRERSYATVILRDAADNRLFVRKQPLYEEGRRSARQLYENICDLKAHGIPVVEHTQLADGSLMQPFIEFPTLSNYCKDKMRDKTAFLRLVDRLYQYILQSSDEAAPERNALLSRSGIAGEKQPDFGPILARAYIELIPLNCFVNPDTEEFLYFDQEFVRENYPAKYVLFRAIHYIYCFTPNAEQLYPKQQLIQAYDMTDTWDIYVKEEERFLEEVRNHKRYRQFYERTKVDWARIGANALRLESEEERVADYRVSDRMKKIWSAELRMLDEVDRICKKHGLTYFLVHGTLLGALRHKGFIPWDDDLDIAMPRASYDRFLEVAGAELSEPLSLHTPETETDMFWGAYARLRNADTTAIEEKDMGHTGNKGIWIDIMPYDVCTADDKKLQRKAEKLFWLQQLLYAKCYGAQCPVFLGGSAAQWRGYRLVAALHSHAALCRKLDAAVRLYTEPEEGDGEIAFFTGRGKYRRLAAADFAGTTQLEFAGRSCPVPVGYENYLFELMGADYRKYPPEEERKPKHRGVFDAQLPYTAYEKKLGNLFGDCGGKTIVLFGAGLMFEDYMKRYGSRYRPAFLVDNDSGKWGRMRLGIEVKSPQELLKLAPDKRHVIICSYYYDEIEKQLRQMGVSDYRIYVQNMEWILERQEGKS